MFGFFLYVALTHIVPTVDVGLLGVEIPAKFEECKPVHFVQPRIKMLQSKMANVKK